MDQPDRPELIVTNFNKNFTGVSATAAAVVARQRSNYEVHLVGRPLPGCPAPVSLAKALSITAGHDAGKPVIWHVRRNAEMLTAIVARDIFRLPLRTVFTSSAQRLHSAFPRWLISRMDAVIATTNKAASFVPKVRAVVAHGVDTEFFKPVPSRLEHWARSGYPGTMGIVSVGRIRPEKGTDIFVDAMIRLLPQLPGAKALVIGRTASEHAAFEAELRNKIATAGLGERILFTDQLDVAGLAELLPAASLLVAAPRYEGYGMTVLEAMACGVPVIASDTGNFAEFIGTSGCGRIADPNDANTIADLALQILKNPQTIDAAGKIGRKRAVDHFTIDGEVDAIGNVYDELLTEIAVASDVQVGIQ